MPPRASGDGPSVRRLYEAALSKAERARLREIDAVEGLDQEIAFLRVCLERLAREEPNKADLLIKGMNLLLRLVVARYKLSPVAKDNLAHNISKVMDEIGGVLMPEAFGK